MNDSALKKITSTVEKSLLRCGFLPGGTGLLLGLSGGADSVMLLLALHKLSETHHFSLACVHVNHMIRGNEAARDEDFCRVLCAKLGVKLHIISENVPKLALQRGTGMEETARQVRYDVYARLLDANPALSHVATAHNATDNTETVVFHMARGCGLRGLCGIPMIRGRVLRPLLSVSKETIVEALKESGWSYVEDSTNTDTKYTRNYIRHELLPCLRKLNPGVDAGISRMCDHLSDDLRFIEQTATDWMLENGVTNKISARQLAELPRALARRVVFSMYKAAGGEKMPEEVHVEPLLSMIAEGQTTFIQRFPGGICAYVEHGRVVFSSHTPQAAEPPASQKIHLGENPLPGRHATMILTRDPNYFKERSTIVYKNAIKADLSSAKIEGTLYVRTRTEGDSYRYGGMTHKIKKLFSDSRLKGIPKAEIPVLCDDRGVVWVPGFSGRDDGNKAQGPQLYAYYCYHGGHDE